MHGDPLEMIAYRIRILPPISNIKQDIPDITKPWYADYAGDLGTFATIETYFNSLTCQGPGCVYYNKLSKSVLIVHQENPEAGKQFEAHQGYKVCTVARYLGGYNGDNKPKSDWLIERTLTWEKNIRTINEPVGNTPMRVMKQWYVQSNKSGYFCNTSPWTRGMRLQE